MVVFYINTIKTTFRFKFWFLSRFFQITSLQVNKKKLLIDSFSVQSYLKFHQYNKDDISMSVWISKKTFLKSKVYKWTKIKSSVQSSLKSHSFWVTLNFVLCCLVGWDGTVRTGANLLYSSLLVENMRGEESRTTSLRWR